MENAAELTENRKKAKEMNNKGDNREATNTPSTHQKWIWKMKNAGIFLNGWGVPAFPASP